MAPGVLFHCCAETVIDVVLPGPFTDDEGNLCWLAAFEIDPANYAWCLRTSNNKFPDLDAKV